MGNCRPQRCMLAKKWDRACVMYGWEHRYGRTNDVGDTCRCATVNVFFIVKTFRECHGRYYVCMVTVKGEGKNEGIMCFFDKFHMLTKI